MKLGAAFWLNDTDWPSLREAITEADAAGFDSLWFDDHLLCDEGAPTDPKLEGWTVAAIFASRPGLRNVLAATRWPIVARVVIAAAAAATVQPSSFG